MSQRWREMLPKYHPLYRERQEEPVYPSMKRMQEPLRTLLMQAMKTCGKDNNAVLSYIEEELTPTQLFLVKEFLAWLDANRLTVGHGTIDLRYHEFVNKLRPMGREEAYQWAMKQAGL